MGRSPCCSKEGLNRGAWTAHEDKILTDYISLHGEGRWRNLPKRAGLKRCGKSCRLRWLNYLRPDIKRGNITPDEEELIIRLHNLLGNRWSLIAGRLPGRTDNEIKNYWNTNLGKRVKDHRNQNNTIVSSSSRRPSAQPRHVHEKASKSTIPMTQVTPNNTLPSPNSPSGSYVVRTKATKCSKVFINPHLPPPPPPNSSEEPRSSCDQTTEAVVKAYDNSGLLPFGAVAGTEQERWSSSSDLLEDFNVGELCLSDLLNSDFSEMCDFSAYSNNNNNSNSNSDSLSPSCCDQPFVFSDEILQDWTQTNAAEANNNVPTNLHCFTSFLESSDCEEWVAE